MPWQQPAADALEPLPLPKIIVSCVRAPLPPELRHAAQQEKHVRHVGGGAGLRGKGVSVGAGFVNGSAMETQFDFTLDNNQSVRCFDARMLAQKECSLTHAHRHTQIYTHIRRHIHISYNKKRN